MDVRIETKKSFYPTLLEWWEKQKFPHVPYQSIPENIFVVSYFGIDLYAVPVYLTDSEISWIGFPTGNKDAPKEHKDGALEYLLDEIGKHVKQMGYNILLTTSLHPKLMKVFPESGFIIADEGTNFYVKQL